MKILAKKKCKQVWNRISKIIYCKSKLKAWIPNCLLIKDKALSQPENITDHFNNYFESINKELQKHIQPTKMNFSDNLKNPSAKSFFMTPAASDEMQTWHKTAVLIKVLDLSAYPHQSRGKLRMKCLFLPAIINHSFDNRIFPNFLKSTKLISVFKNGSRLFCKNCRRIYLLSNIGKIIENLIHRRLYVFLEQHKVFLSLQFVFCLKTFTNDALMLIAQNIQTHVDKNELTEGVFELTA